jgi:hypothetical protein
MVQMFASYTSKFTLAEIPVEIIVLLACEKIRPEFGDEVSVGLSIAVCDIFAASSFLDSHHTQSIFHCCGAMTVNHCRSNKVLPMSRHGRL